MLKGLHNLSQKGHSNTEPSNHKKFSKDTEHFAYKIWESIFDKYTKFSPTSISIYHNFDGTIAIKCDSTLFYDFCDTSYDKELLRIVSNIAENSNIKGKMYLHSPKDYLKQLDFRFQYP